MGKLNKKPNKHETSKTFFLSHCDNDKNYIYIYIHIYIYIYIYIYI